MATTIDVLDVLKHPDGRLEFRFSDGTSDTYQSLAHARDVIAGLDTGIEAEAFVRRLVVAWFLARSADASNVNLIKNKSLTWDLSAPAPLRVQ